jgi:predicted glycosyltransferase
MLWDSGAGDSPITRFAHERVMENTPSPSLRGRGLSALLDAPGSSPQELASWESLGRRPRIALYSHDTQGLGHLRRNLLLASVFHRMPCEPVILLCSGARELGAFAIPPTVDCLTLPAIGKDILGQYGPRRLNLPLNDVVDIRRRVLDAALCAFEPDVLIVDKAPRGLMGELDPVLQTLRGRCRIILGMREVLDDPCTVQREWQQERCDEVIDECYDRVWVYGDQRVFDPVSEYGFGSQLAAKARYTGYLNPREAFMPGEDPGVANIPETAMPPEPTVLCAVGGGQDGAPLARAFLESQLPAGHSGVLVTGPQMPPAARAEFRQRASHRPGMHVFEFITDCGRLINHAARVITMGGYNTVCELLSNAKPGLIVPRVFPRTEQLIRASRLRDLGLVDMLHPEHLTPEALSAWLAGPGPHPLQPNDTRLDMRGVSRLPNLLWEAIAPAAREVAVASA